MNAILCKPGRPRLAQAATWFALCAALPLSPAWGAPGKWEMAAPMPQAMGEVVGVAVNTSLFVFGGLNNAGGSLPYGAAFRFDEDSSRWTVLKPMPEPAHHLMATALGGKIYLFGGFVAGGLPKPTWKPSGGAWEYDPATDTYRALAPLPRARGAGYAVTLGDKIYVMGAVAASVDGKTSAPIALGGPLGQTVVGWVDEYDVASNTWRPRATMPTPRNHFMAAEAGGKIYALDGRTGSVFVNQAAITDLVEAYDPARDSWALASRAGVARGDVNGAALDGVIFMTGGESQSDIGKTTYWAFEAYDPRANAWTALPHLQITRHGFAAAFIGNKLHVVGGSFQSDGMPGILSPTATHEVYEVRKTN